MKKITLFICLIFMLLLAACGNGSGSSETSGASASGTDSAARKLAPEDRNQTLWGIMDFVETQDGYYYAFVNSDNEEKQKGLYLYFCPRGGDQFVPLCAKPNCRHNDQNCNAFFESGNSLGYYNGALYVVEYDIHGDGYNVVKCNLDGTTHSVVATVPCEGGFSAMYHKGKYYIHLFGDENEPIENRNDRKIVVDLADGSQSELASDPGNSFLFYQNKVYGFGPDQAALSEGKKDAYHVYEHDLETGEGRDLGFDTETTLLCVQDSTLYWFESDKDYMGEKYCDVEPGFREYDLASGTLKNCGMPFEDANTAVRDEEYIFLMGFANQSGKNRTLYFLSKDYKLVDQIKLEGDNVLAVAASDRVFVCDMMSMTITGCIEKSAIGSGNLEVKPIQTVG